FLALFTTTILLVPRQATLTRFTSVIALSTLTYVLQETFLQLCKNPHWRAAAAPLLWIQFLSASEWILISRLDAAHIPRRRGKHQLDTLITQVTDVIALLWNLRRVNTKWQTKNIPTNSSSGPTSSSRSHFILRRLTTTLIAYLVMDIMVSAPPPDPNLVRPEKATLLKLHDLSSEDLIFRTIGTLSFWFSTALINLILSNTTAILSVLSGLSAPSNCPPLYGSILEAYTIRNFWGTTWHQCLRPSITGPADTLTTALLPLPPTTLPARYTRLLLAFLISGLIHHASDIAMGIPLSSAGSFSFFLLQPLGIMLEDGIQWLTSGSRSAFERRARRVVGYVWVVAFLTWTTPRWFYPQQRLGVDAGGLVPVRVV
ncbi:membrane bound O-acyl transferase family-domain-containing protein, partial [Usnea florida]